MKKQIFAFLVLLSSAVVVPAQTLSNYQSVVLGQNPAHYFTFDNGSLTSVTNPITLTASTGVGFVNDVFRNPSDSVTFSNTADTLVDSAESSDHLINGGGTANTSSTAAGTVTLMFKSLDAGLLTAQKYVFSAGVSTAGHNALSLFFENTNSANGDPQSLKLRFGDTTLTLLQATNVVADTWYYFALTYNETATPNGSGTQANKCTWYLGRAGGTLASGITTNNLDAVAGDGVDFYIGNRPTTDTGFRLPGNGQVDEFAIWNRQLSAAEIQAQFGNVPNRVPPPLSTYQGVITNQSPSYYFKLDGNFVDSASGSLTLGTNSGGTSFGSDWFGDLSNSCVFSGSADALTNGSLITGGGNYNGTAGTGKGAISCLFRSLSSTNFSGQKFIFSAGGNTTTTNGFGLLFENLTASSNPGSLKVRFGNVSSTILGFTNIVTADWYYFAMNYDESKTTGQITWWLGQPGGTLQSGVINALANSLAGQGNIFVIGNHTNYTSGFRNGNSVNGQIDEFAIWHRALATNEVNAQFNALIAPPAVLSPKLSIATVGTNVLLSWPASTDPGYALQSNTNLASTNWISAGTPGTVGANFVVTNGAGPKAQYYRLKK